MELKDIEIGKLKPSPANVRKTVRKADLAGLAWIIHQWVGEVGGR